MNTQNTLKIYERNAKQSKSSYRYFFIRKDLHSMFDNLGTFSLTCSDGTHYENLHVHTSKAGNRHFIYAAVFFNDHPKIEKDVEVSFTIDSVKKTVHVIL